MIRNKIIAKIDFTPSTALSGVDVVIPDTNFPFNNTSKTLTDRLEKNNGDNRLMVMGDATNKGTTITYNDFWADTDFKFNGFTGGLTDNNGVLIENPNTITLTIKAFNNAIVDNVTVFFDNVAQQWAIEAYLDGNVNNKIYNDDNEWAIVFPTEDVSHTITFTKWHRPNYNARITFLGFELDSKILDKRWYNEIALTQQIMPLQSKPFIDVMASVGSINLRDLNGELRDYAEDGILKSNLDCEILINDYTVATYIVDKWDDYKDASKTVMANLIDKLGKLDNKFGGITIQEQRQSAWSILHIIHLAMGLEFNTSKIIVTGINNNLQEQSIEYYLRSILLPNAFLESSTRSEALAKICQLGTLQTYFGANKEIYFDTARPRLTTQEKLNIIDIPADTQETDWEEVIVPKNNYDGVEWEETIIQDRTTTSIPSGVSWNAITSYNGSYVAVGRGGAIDGVAYSTDGKTFTSGTIPTATWNSITNYNGFYVAVGTDAIGGCVAYSTDGRTFTSGSINKSVEWESITTYNGFYVAVGHSAIVAYSTDGITFTNGSIPMGSWNSITNYNGFYVAIGGSKSAYSTDGKTFVSGTIPLGMWQSITNYNGFYVAVGNAPATIGYNNIAYSTDGITFTNGSIPTGTWYSITNYNGFYVAVGRDGEIGSVAYSTDGKTFVSGKPPYTKPLVAITNYDGFYVALGGTNSIIYSMDGIIFTEISFSTSSIIKSLGGKNNIYPMKTNELFQFSSTIGGKPIGQFNAECIRDDYSTKNGIRTATVTIFGSVDFKSNGEKVVVWNGENDKPTILEKGSIVRALNKQGTSVSKYKDGTDRLWKITGLQLRVVGNTRIGLELREAF